MKAIRIERHCPPEVLKFVDLPEPELRRGQVRMRVRATGINFADIAARLGFYPDAPRPPFIPGLEASGEIEELGSEATGFSPGQAAMALTRSGAYAEKLCVPASQVVSIPTGMSFETAAALPVNYLTAYHMLFTMGNVRPSERVLIHAAAGGVGLAAIELCQIAGAEVIATASSSKFDFLRSRGVKHLVDYRREDFEKQVRHITGGEGVDIVLDAVGGESFTKSYRLLRGAGRLMVFGFSSAITGLKRNLLKAAGQYFRRPKFDPLRLMGENRAVLGVHLGRLPPEIIRQEYAALLKHFAEGHIHPFVGKSFPLSEASAAHLYIQERKNFGKVLLIP